MSVSCILQGQDDKSLKLEGQQFIQEFKDVTQQVKNAAGVNAAAKLSGIQFGRPRKPLPENFEELYQRFRNNEPISRLAKECPQISESTLRLRLQERLTLDKHP